MKIQRAAAVAFLTVFCLGTAHVCSTLSHGDEKIRRH